jgi:hypothetical protein
MVLLLALELLIQAVAVEAVHHIMALLVVQVL